MEEQAIATSPLCPRTFVQSSTGSFIVWQHQQQHKQLSVDLNALRQLMFSQSTPSYMLS